jgi:predicted DNA-binding protein YlxM (UPF0122 family)
MQEFDRMIVYRLYVEEQLTIREIATMLSVHHQKVYAAMIRWRIPRRKGSHRPHRSEPKRPLDQATLQYHYHELGQTIKEIAVQFNVSNGVVHSAMKYWGIPRRRCGPKPKRQVPNTNPRSSV